MTYPTVDVNLTNLDAGTDSPAAARSDLLDLATKFNALRPLPADLANVTDPTKGAALVGLYDGLAPAFLKVTSDLLSLSEVSVLRFIDPAKWSAIAAETNTDNLSSAFSAAFGASAKGINLYVPHGLYHADQIAMQYNNSSIRGARGAQLMHTVAGREILSASGLTGISVEGLQFTGLGSSTAPLNSIGGYASTSTGILTLANCTDVRVQRCAATAFYNGISTLGCTDLDVDHNRITHWWVYGILGSLSSQASFDHNNVQGNDQTTGASVYGIMVTGNEAGSQPSKGISISFNRIWDIPSWDGIMSHDCNGLTIIGNDIRNVRNGVDISYSVASLFLRNVNVSNNYIECTTTNNWGGTGASSSAIYPIGFNSSNLIDTLVVSGNICRNFGNITGSTIGGNAGVIAIGYANDAVISGNLIEGTGTIGGYAGILAAFPVNSLSVTGNTLRGSHTAGAIRGASLATSTLAITGNAINQVTNTDPAVQITGSTIASLVVSNNSSNSTVPFSQSGSTITLANSGTFTATLTGCTTAPTGLVQYAINGNTVTLSFPSLSATSNSTSCTLTGLPAFLQPMSVYSSLFMQGQNGGAYVTNTTAVITPNSGTITLQLGGSSTGWANTSGKGIFGTTITYSLN